MSDFVSEHLAKVETITEVLQEILTQSGEQLEECQEIEMIPELLDALGKVVTCREETRNFKSHYDSSSQEVRATATELRIDELKSNLQRLLDNPVEVAWRRSREYKEMKERLWEVNHPDEALPEGSSDEEGDLVVATAKQSLICPITQSDFVDPVTNPSCGHSYSRAGITALAERRAGSVQCPIHGCRHAVVIANLTRNTRLERRVARKKQPKIY